MTAPLHALTACALLALIAAGARAAEPAVTHLPDDPPVEHVCAVAPDILCITIQSQRVQKTPQAPYVPQPGDEVRESGEDVLAWQGGKVVATKQDVQVFRAAEGGKAQSIGRLAINAGKLWPPETLLGRPLNEAALLDPAAYSISSPDDANYRAPLRPAVVHHKSKPNDLDVNNQWPVRHWVYLVLPHALKEGKTYAVRFEGVNTREAVVNYTHNPRAVRSDAVHVTQVGYRPGDPFKRAYLSTWLGTGGALAYDAQTFQIIDDATGAVAYEGKVTLGLAADRPEQFPQKVNQTHTNVYYMDFADFERPGAYRVLVPGIGAGYPFRIADDAWADAFKVSMKGFLHHRSGIALGPPFTDYVRPRPMHPADGFRVFDLDITFWTGEAAAVNEALKRMLGPSLDPAQLKTYPAAWGGYMDAGDWDRRTPHLRPTYLHLELLDLFPDYFERLALALPPEEAGNSLPDVLDEALWNLSLYRRLQRPDGGVGGGVESTAHPRSGECSYQESLLVGTFAPDPETSYFYAADAAKAARLLAKYDAALSAEYRDSTLKAWQWAEANTAMAAGAEREEAVRRVRALAAAELYHLTRDRVFDAAFKQAMAAGSAPFDAVRDAWFAYALLPDDLADPALKQKAVDGYRKLGDTALQFMAGNAFNLAIDVPFLPMIGYVGYYSTPGASIGPGLPRAHYLTGEAKYLAGTVAACNYGAGANPMNMSMTVGVGHDYPRVPLHIDGRRSGQEPPAGITVYGPFDPALSNSSTDWAHTWVLANTMTPASRTWPAAEFYVDVWKWPPMNEYTVHQTFGPTSYHWGYLAARK